VCPGQFSASKSLCRHHLTEFVEVSHEGFFFKQVRHFQIESETAQESSSGTPHHEPEPHADAIFLTEALQPALKGLPHVISASGDVLELLVGKRARKGFTLCTFDVRNLYPSIDRLHFPEIVSHRMHRFWAYLASLDDFIVAQCPSLNGWHRYIDDACAILPEDEANTVFERLTTGSNGISPPEVARFH